MAKNSLLVLGVSVGAMAGFAVYRAMNPPHLARFDLPVTGARRAALITGASVGIGESFAHQLAQLGYDPILVARRRDRLERLAAELERRHAVKPRIVAADLTQPTDIVGVAELIDTTLDLEVLVNNAGFGTLGEFAALPVSSQTDMVRVHVEASVQFTRAALPQMLARGRGAIVNVASIAAWSALPLNVTYSASKRFLTNFSEALQAELDGSGVFVQALCPGMTDTEFHRTDEFRNAGFNRDAIPSRMWMSADRVVAESLRALGNGNPIYIPGALNKAIVLAQAFLPQTSLMRRSRRVARRMMRRATQDPTRPR